MIRTIRTPRRPLLAALASVAIIWPLAAEAIETSREDVQAFIREVSAAHGLDTDYLRNALGSARSQQAILEAMAKPAERVKPWREYRAIFLTAARIEAGTAFWKEHESRLSRIADATGVPIEILTGIVGVETYFGQRTGNYRVLDSLATLAFDYPPRSKFFQAELTQFFLLARDEKLAIEELTGSYAGAMGPPQFIPSSYRQYAVDGDGDQRRDLFTNWDDILGSIANYFVAHKWQKGQPVAARGTPLRPINHQPGDNKLAAGDTVAGLGERGLRFSTDLAPSAPAGLIALEGEDGIEYWAGFHNFFVITRYNRSVMYALAVHQLGQSIGDMARSGPDGPLRRADAL
jgi:membrane-bound lytic murein transglycosylase B